MKPLFLAALMDLLVSPPFGGNDYLTRTVATYYTYSLLFNYFMSLHQTIWNSVINPSEERNLL